jgi:hypothetical protein
VISVDSARLEKATTKSADADEYLHRPYVLGHAPAAQRQHSVRNIVPNTTATHSQTLHDSCDGTTPTFTAVARVSRDNQNRKRDPHTRTPAGHSPSPPNRQKPHHGKVCMGTTNGDHKPKILDIRPRIGQNQTYYTITLTIVLCSWGWCNCAFLLTSSLSTPC